MGSYSGSLARERDVGNLDNELGDCITWNRALSCTSLNRAVTPCKGTAAAVASGGSSIHTSV